MLIIKGQNIYTEDGRLLKTLDCPMDITAKELQPIDRFTYSCTSCDKAVVNTDYMAEDEIVNRLSDEPDTCLKINKFNPIFRIM